MTTNTFKTIVAAALLAAVSAPVFAGGNIAAGEAKATAVCAACHGPAGNAPITPDYPKLAGQHADYIANALRDYQLGNRKNAIMGAQAQALTRQEIDDLAAYFASQKGNLAVKY
jgi:cytochrome c553